MSDLVVESAFLNAELLASPSARVVTVQSLEVIIGKQVKRTPDALRVRGIEHLPQVSEGFSRRWRAASELPAQYQHLRAVFSDLQAAGSLTIGESAGDAGLLREDFPSSLCLLYLAAGPLIPERLAMTMAAFVGGDFQAL